MFHFSDADDCMILKLTVKPDQRSHLCKNTQELNSEGTT